MFFIGYILDYRMKRRRVLTSGCLGLAAVAGCQTDSETGMIPSVTDGTATSQTETLTTPTTENLQDCTNGFRVYFERFEPVEQLTIGLDHHDSPRSIIEEAVQSGSATIKH